MKEPSVENQQVKQPVSRLNVARMRAEEDFALDQFPEYSIGNVRRHIRLRHGSCPFVAGKRFYLILQCEQSRCKGPLGNAHRLAMPQRVGESLNALRASQVPSLADDEHIGINAKRGGGRTVCRKRRTRRITLMRQDQLESVAPA